MLLFCCSAILFNNSKDPKYYAPTILRRNLRVQVHKGFDLIITQVTARAAQQMVQVGTMTLLTYVHAVTGTGHSSIGQ